jgi:hypothetical protein
MNERLHDNDRSHIMLQPFFILITFAIMRWGGESPCTAPFWVAPFFADTLDAMDLSSLMPVYLIIGVAKSPVGLYFSVTLYPSCLYFFQKSFYTLHHHACGRLEF